MIYADLSGKIIEAAIEVHQELGGPGLLEKIYEEALMHELKAHGMKVNRQIFLPVYYKGTKMQESLRIDLLVDDRVVIECKAVEQFNKLFLSQCLTYLRVTNKKLGMVINFGSPVLYKGVYRVVN